MFYPWTISCVKALFPGVDAKEDLSAATSPEQILWMCQKISEMPNDSAESALKAARWMGWILCAVETSGVGWTNQDSRTAIRHDVSQGADQSHT